VVIKKGGDRMRINTRDAEGKPMEGNVAEFRRAMKKVWLVDKEAPVQKVSLREV